MINNEEIMEMVHDINNNLEMDEDLLLQSMDEEAEKGPVIIMWF